MGAPQVEGVGGVGSPSGLSGANRSTANLMLDMLEQAMKQSGLQNEQTSNALQGLRNEINGNQKAAADQLNGGNGTQSAKGADGLSGAEGPGDAEGKDAKGLIEMLMKLLQMLMPLLQQLTQGKQGGTNGTANSLATGMPDGSGSPLGQGSGQDNLGNLFTSYGEMFEGMNKHLKPMLGNNLSWN